MSSQFLSYTDLLSIRQKIYRFETETDLSIGLLYFRMKYDEDECGQINVDERSHNHKVALINGAIKYV